MYFFQFKEHACLLVAWNKGISLAKDKYIVVTNNDTVVPPN
jgi:hypothetical protein